MDQSGLKWTKVAWSGLNGPSGLKWIEEDQNAILISLNRRVNNNKYDV